MPAESVRLSQEPIMFSAVLDNDARTVRVRWGDDHVADFSFLWLRDNCPSGLHPLTRERTFDLLSVSEDVHPLSLDVDAGGLRVVWSGDDHVSRFSAEWLRAWSAPREVVHPLG
jgi:gamma-butyrobetaine dioxygenase